MEITSVLELIQSKTVTPKNVSTNDLARASNWLEAYEFNGSLTKGELEFAQAIANVIGLLDKEISRRNKAKK